MEFNRVHFSSLSTEWATPDAVFDQLHSEFNFTIDVAASAQNAKCQEYYDKFVNGLEAEWAGNVWCNPPYGREISAWVKKAYESWQAKKTNVIVMLLPARVDTKWFHEYCRFGEIRFIKGRLKFGGHKESAPFPSMVVIFK